MRNAVVTVMVLGTCLTLQAASPPSIDGSLDDPFWSIDARVWTVTDPEAPGSAVQFLLGYDERFLYLAADVADTDVVGTRRSRKGTTWLDDSVEFCIDFGNGTALERTPETWQYSFSAAGGANWTRGIGDGSGRRYPAHDWPPDWQSEVQWATRLRPGTTLNNATHIDTGYTVEARVPLKEMGRTGPLRPDGSIGVNFVNMRQASNSAAGRPPLSILPGLKPEEIHNPSRWQRIRLSWEAPFAIRGLALDMPTQPEQADAAFRWGRSDADWRNQAGWTAQLSLMQKRGLNALLLNCADPDQVLAKGVAQGGGFDAHVHFRWILNEARAHGVRVYLALECEVSAPTTQPTDTRPATSQAVRAQSIVDLAQAFPELAGLAVTAPRGDPNSSKWLLEIGRAMQAIAARPRPTAPAGTDPAADPQELLVRVQDESPELIALLMAMYPHIRLLHDFQEGSWTSPQMDPQAARLEAEVAGASTRKPALPVSGVAIGGPGRASEYLLWSDPAWMRDVSLDLRRNGLDGMFLRPTGTDPWLAIEAWGACAIQSGDVFNQKRWCKRLEETYGVGEYAGQLLEAMQHASAIVPRFCSLVNGRSPDYMPQLGLPLVCALGLPTATAVQSAKPPVPATRPSTQPSTASPALPWLTPIAGIAEDVNLQAPPGAIGPERIAQTIASDAAACRSRLTGLRHVKPALPQQGAELSVLLDRIELNAALGEHYEHWIRAGVAWEQFRTRRGPQGTYIAELQKARDGWAAAAAVATRLHPEPVSFAELQIASAPPWTGEQIRRNYRPVRGHWRDQAAAFDRELAWLREQSGTGGNDSPTLPTWDLLHAWPPTQLQGIFRLSFNPIDEGRYRLGEGSGPVNQEGISIRGTSLVLNTRGQGGGWHRAFETNPAAMAIPLGRAMEIVLLYRVLQPSADDPEPFMASIRTAGPGPAFGDLPRWGAPAGHEGLRVIKVPPLQGGPHIVTIDVLGEAAIVIDEVRLEAVKMAQ